jgi:hypothetical protein
MKASEDLSHSQRPNQVPDMKAWLLTNPQKDDYYAFVRNWIREQTTGRQILAL